MDIDDDILLDWEDDTAFNDIPDVSSLHSYNDNFRSNPRNQISTEVKKEENCLGKMENDMDYAIAMSLQIKFDDELKENANSNSKKSEALSIIDKQWELIDPHPDIHALFVEFDEKFFYGKLKSVEVRWSSRMTLCAGLCSYQGRGGLCSIGLSMPLLKLRPRQDLVETLLHEMIHAYLFVTQNNKDRDGHGPEFLSNMHRINKEAGTNITVFHSFHAEVNLYKQHWWKCDGPCRNKSPFFGLVKRSMNRAPGPNDNWWAAHQLSCGGKFVKIKEPSNFSKEKPQKKKFLSDSKSKPYLSDIRNFIKVGSPSSKESRKSTVSEIESPIVSALKFIPSKKETSVTTNFTKPSKKEKNFVPFLGIGHKLDSSTETSQASSSFSSINLKDLLSSPLGNDLINEDVPFTSSEKAFTKRDWSSSSSGKILIKGNLQSSFSGKPLISTPYPKSDKIPRMSSESDIQNVQRDHASSSFSTSISNLQKFHSFPKKISNSTSTSSYNAEELNQSPLEKIVPSRNTCNSSDCIQGNSAIDVNFQSSVCMKLFCPVCSNLVMEEINSHLDKCLKNQTT